MAGEGYAATVTGEDREAMIGVDPAPDDIEVERLDEAVRDNDVWRARLSYSPDTVVVVSLDVNPE